MLNQNPFRARALFWGCLVLFLFLTISLGRADNPQRIANDSIVATSSKTTEAPTWEAPLPKSEHRSLLPFEQNANGCTFNVALENISSSTAFDSIRIKAVGQTKITSVKAGYWTLVSSSPTVAVLKPPMAHIPIGLFIFGISIQGNPLAITQKLQIEWIGRREKVLCSQVLNVPRCGITDNTRLSNQRGIDNTISPQLDCGGVSATITSDEVLDVQALTQDSDCDAAFTQKVNCNADGTTTYSFTNTTDYDTAIPGIKYSWSIVDANLSKIHTADTIDTSYTFSKPGKYQVQLCAFGTPCGTSDVDNCEEETLEISIPKASFSWKEKDCEPFKINFTNESEGTGLSYSWTFGDSSSTSNTSTLTNPQHEFKTANIYNVCLTVKDSDGNCNRICQQVEVSSVPKADFDWEYSACDPGVELSKIKVTFTDKSKGAACPIKYFWDFGDGDTTQPNTQAGPIHTYAVGGTYDVTLRIRDAKYPLTPESVQSHKFAIKARPPLNFTTQICATGEVVCQTTEPNPMWNFSGGNPTTATGAQATAAYNTPGQYTIILTSKDENHNVCKSEKRIIITEIESCTRRHTYRDTSDFSYNGKDYRIIKKLVVMSGVFGHYLKVKTKLKKKYALGYWRVKAKEIRAQMQGKIYKSEGKCCCAKEEILFGGLPQGAKKQDSRVAKYRYSVGFGVNFTTRADSLTSIHYVKVDANHTPIQQTHSFTRWQSCKQ